MKMLICAAFALVSAASVAFAAPTNYRTRPTLDGFAVDKNGKKVFHHYNNTLGGYPAPRCYTSGKRTDCYWKQPTGANRYRYH